MDRPSLGELARVFTKLGFTAFGGPAAHIAMMDTEVVQRRSWMTRERFLDLVGTANVLPGPSSTELAILIGHDQRGWRGLVVGGACFILPAVAIVMAIAWVYVRYGAMPELAGALYGLEPVIIAVVAQALWGLGKTALKTPWLGAIAAAALAAALIGVDAITILAGAGAIATVAGAVRGRSAAPPSAWLPLPLLGTAAAPVIPAAIGAWPVFLTFLKVGSVLFGSGYVLLAFLRADLVEHLHWLTEAQLLDAVAIGQVTPGPVFTTATFVGYLVDGPAGAGAATLGIFLPAFVLVAVSGPLVLRLRRSPIAAAVLDAINAASLALMAAVMVMLGRAAVIDVPTAAIAAASAVVLIRYKPNAAWLVLAGAVVGTAIHAVSV